MENIDSFSILSLNIMINFDLVNNNIKNNNTNNIYSYTHPFRILIISPSGSGKTNLLRDIINEREDIDKIYLFARDLNEHKYELLINTRKKVGINHCNDENEFIESFDSMDYVFFNIDDFNIGRKRKVVIIFDDMIPDIVTNKNYQQVIKELFMRSRKINIYLIILSFFSIPKNNTYELNNIASSFCCDIERRDILKLYRKHTDEQYSFFTIDTTLNSNNDLKYRKPIIISMSLMTRKDQMLIFNNKIKQINSD